MSKKQVAENREGKASVSRATHLKGFPSSLRFPSICIWTFTRSVGLAKNCPMTPAIIPPMTDFLIAKRDSFVSFFLKKQIATRVTGCVREPYHTFTGPGRRLKIKDQHKQRKAVRPFTGGQVQGSAGPNGKIRHPPIWIQGKGKWLQRCGRLHRLFLCSRNLPAG